MTSYDLELRPKVGTIYRLRTSLIDQISVLRLAGRSYDIHDVRKVFDALAPVFPKVCRESPKFGQALHRSLENYLIGSKHSRKLENELVAVLAGCFESLAEGLECVPQPDRTCKDYCLAVVKNVYPSSPDCNTEFSVVLEILSGPVSGSEMEFAIWNEALLFRLLSLTGLVPRHKPEVQERLLHPRFLAGCLLFVRPTETEGRVFIKDMGTNSALRSKNKTLHRLRTINRKCPRDFEWACSVCPVGTQLCRLATHPLNAVRGTCCLCGEEEWLDADNQRVASFDCQDRLWYS